MPAPPQRAARLAQSPTEIASPSNCHRTVARRRYQGCSSSRDAIAATALSRAVAAEFAAAGRKPSLFPFVFPEAALLRRQRRFLLRRLRDGFGLRRETQNAISACSLMTFVSGVLPE